MADVAHPRFTDMSEEDVASDWSISSGDEGAVAAVPGLAFDSDFVAAKLHDLWREGRRQADGTINPRIKLVNGVEYDIANTEFADLPQKFKTENQQAGRTAYNSVREEAARLKQERGVAEFSMLDDAFIERAADRQHQAWVERNAFWGQTSLMVDYCNLPEEEKEKDRVIVREVLRQLAMAWGSMNASGDLRLQELPSSFTVRIERSLDIFIRLGHQLSMQGKHKPNPMVLINAGSGKTYTSQTCWETTDPTWNEQLAMSVDDTFQGVHVAVMHVHKRNSPAVQQSLIGKLAIPKTSLLEQAVRDQWFTLYGNAEGMYIAGAVHVEVFVSPGEGDKERAKPSMLKIQVVEAKNVLLEGKASVHPYVEVTLASAKHRTKKKKGSEASFRETFEMEVPPVECGSATLDLTVFHSKMLGADVFLGHASVPVQELRALEGLGWRTMWLDLSARNAAESQENAASTGKLKLRVGYYEFPVMPVEAYSPLLELLSRDDGELLHLLGQTSEEPEAVGSCTVRVLYCMGDGPSLAVAHLKRLLCTEIKSTPRVSTLFRQDSIATKTATAFMRYIVCEQYLRDVFGPPLMAVMADKKLNRDHLLNPDKVAEAAPEFLRLLEMLRNAIFNSAHHVPPEMRRLFAATKDLVATKFPGEANAPYIAVSGLFFLRFLVPALMRPYEYGILDTPVDTVHIKVFMHMAKALQRVANLTTVSGGAGRQRGSVLEGSERFQEEGRAMLRAFIDVVTHEDLQQEASSAADSVPRVKPDFEKELAVLHGLFRRDLPGILARSQSESCMSLARVLQQLNRKEVELVTRDDLHYDEAPLDLDTTQKVAPVVMAAPVDGECRATDSFAEMSLNDRNFAKAKLGASFKMHSRSRFYPKDCDIFYDGRSNLVFKERKKSHHLLCKDIVSVERGAGPAELKSVAVVVGTLQKADSRMLCLETKKRMVTLEALSEADRDTWIDLLLWLRDNASGEANEE